MINAGIDIFCFGNNLIYDPNIVKKVHLIVMKLLDEDKISIDNLQKSYFRVLNMKSIINIT
jgi:beta-N-acetylhexosaminidase